MGKEPTFPCKDEGSNSVGLLSSKGIGNRGRRVRPRCHATDHMALGCVRRPSVLFTMLIGRHDDRRAQARAINSSDHVRFRSKNLVKPKTRN